MTKKCNKICKCIPQYTELTGGSEKHSKPSRDLSPGSPIQKPLKELTWEVRDFLEDVIGIDKPEELTKEEIRNQIDCWLDDSFGL